jgi:hypothetical protein
MRCQTNEEDCPNIFLKDWCLTLAVFGLNPIGRPAALKLHWAPHPSASYHSICSSSPRPSSESINETVHGASFVGWLHACMRVLIDSLRCEDQCLTRPLAFLGGSVEVYVLIVRPEDHVLTSMMDD